MEDHSVTNNYAVELSRMPQVQMRTINASTPSMSIGITESQTANRINKSPSGIITYEPMPLTFIVDENLESWREVFSWITDLQTADDPSTLYTDFSVIIPNAQGSGGWSFNYIDAWPSNLDAVDFTSRSGSEPVTCGVTMVYNDVTVTKA